MYLNGLYKPLQGVLHLHAKKINFITYHSNISIVNQPLNQKESYAN